MLTETVDVAEPRALVARMADFVTGRLARLPHWQQAEINAFPDGQRAREFAIQVAKEWEETWMW